MLPLPSIDFNDVQEKLVTHFRPWQRSFQFWARAADIYTGYKVIHSRCLSLSLVPNACINVHVVQFLLYGLVCDMGFIGFVQVFQLRVSFVKDAKKQEEMWENQHEVAAEKIYSMCYDLGGFFLKVLEIKKLVKYVLSILLHCFGLSNILLLFL